MRWIVSFLPPIENETEHIKQKEDGTWVVRANGEVLLGKLSFQMITEDELDIAGFGLVTSAENSPNTGIKISVDGNENNDLEEQERFIFTDKTKSEEKDVFLNNIIVSNTKENQEDPNNPIYKEYDLTPEFNKETNQYEITLLEYIDDIDIKATLSDLTSNMKVKAPKRDEQGKLIYEADGATLVYEDKELANDTNQNILLNELGTTDTIITIIVISDDKTVTNEYQITIKRPYGVIKGSIQLGSELREATMESYGNTIEYIANVSLYKAGEFNWNGILTEDTFLEEADEIKPERTTNTEGENGAYEIYVIPGVYDLKQERLGFLANIITEITVNENDVIDLDNVILVEGDINRSGIADLDDIVDVLNAKGLGVGDDGYEERYDYGQKGYVALDDILSVLNGKGNYINIEKYE